jgi:hypothetical protein
MTKALALLASIAAASILAGSGTAAAPAKQFDVVLPKTNSTYVDTGKKGYTPGDYFLATGPLLDRVGGARIGGLVGVWTLVSPAADKASITIHLERGTLYVDGVIRHTAKQSVLRVVGGTDAFAGAHGTAALRYLTETSGAVHVSLS